MNGHPGNADVPVGSSGKEVNGDVGVLREWYSRGYLPHRNTENVLQSITFRLADSLPQEKLKQLAAELEAFPESRRVVENRRRIEQWLDAGMGCCTLCHPEVAQYVQNAILHFERDRYRLHAWCIMPNHVHVLIEPKSDLYKIVQGWKSYTARWVLKQNDRLQLGIPQSKQLWMREYWDRYIRNLEHYNRVVEYIHENPAKAGLCQAPEDWPWSSAKWGHTDVLVGSIGKEADGDVGAPSTTNIKNSSHP